MRSLSDLHTTTFASSILKVYVGDHFRITQTYVTRLYKHTTFGLVAISSSNRNEHYRSYFGFPAMPPRHDVLAMGLLYHNHLACNKCHDRINTPSGQGRLGSGIVFTPAGYPRASQISKDPPVPTRRWPPTNICTPFCEAYCYMFAKVPEFLQWSTPRTTNKPRCIYHLYYSSVM